MSIVYLNDQQQPESPPPTEPPAPMPFPSPIDPPLGTPPPPPAEPEPEPAAARGPVADPMGFIALATLHAEHAERARVFCVEQAAGLADLVAHRVAFGPARVLTREQVVSLFRVLAGQIRTWKDPRTMHEHAGGPA
jgi:hypothetical protein